MGFVAESQMKGDPATFAAITKLKPGESTEILPLLDERDHPVRLTALIVDWPPAML